MRAFAFAVVTGALSAIGLFACEGDSSGPPRSSLYDVWGAVPGDLLAIGTNGNLLHCTAN